jgi:hypothetical protein
LRSSVDPVSALPSLSQISLHVLYVVRISETWQILSND